MKLEECSNRILLFISWFCKKCWWPVLCSESSKGEFQYKTFSSFLRFSIVSSDWIKWVNTTKLMISLIESVFARWALVTSNYSEIWRPNLQILRCYFVKNLDSQVNFSLRSAMVSYHIYPYNEIHFKILLFHSKTAISSLVILHDAIYF